MVEHNFEMVWSKISLHSSKNTFQGFTEKIFSSNCYMNTNHIKILDIDFVYKFINLPLPVGERILKAIQADKDFLLKEDFINLMFQLYYDNFDSLVVFFFKIFDFNRDKIISKKDVIFLFKHIDPNSDNIINNFFDKSNSLTYEQYIQSININCDIVLLFFYYVSSKKVFSDYFLFYLSDMLDDKQPKEDGSVVPIRRRNRSSTKLLYNKKNLNFSKCTEQFLNSLLVNSSQNVNNNHTRKKHQLDFDDEYDVKKRITALKCSSELVSVISKQRNEKEDTTIINSDINEINDIKKTNNEDYEDLLSLSEFENDVANYMKNLQTTITPAEPNKLNQKNLKLTNLTNSFLLSAVTMKSSIEPVTEYFVKYQGSQLKKIVLYGSNFLILFERDKSKYNKILSFKGSYVYLDERNQVHIDSSDYKSDYVFTFNNEDEKKDFLSRIGYQNVNDDYEFREKVASGKFGEVYHAIKGYKDYAIKVVKKQKLMKQQNRNEVYISKYLMIHKHRNIVDIIDVYDTKKSIYIVMEYIPYGHIPELEQRVMTTSIKEKIVTQLISAVSFLNNHNIVHRDVKMGNLLVTNRTNYHIKLIDFGLSILLPEGEYARDCCGTFLYAAPEVLLKQKYNNKIDAWSIGILTFALLFGEIPLEVEEAKDEQQLAQNFEEFCLIVKNLREVNLLDTVIKQCIIMKSTKRACAVELLKSYK